MIANSKNVVIVYYPNYAGGKFVINCLGFNEKFCPSISLLRNTDNQHLPVEQQLESKIPSILKTLPPDKQSCRQWGSYELQCGDFWGDHAEGLLKDPDTVESKIYNISKQILADHYGFLIAHNQKVLGQCQNYFSKARTIRLENYKEFRSRAVRLKMGLPPPFGNLNEHVRADFSFDMSTVFEWEKFLAELTRCVEFFECEPVFDSRLKSFYQDYLSLHL